MTGLHGAHAPDDTLTYGLAEKWGNCIANLFVLVDESPEKPDIIRESLQSRCLPNANDPVLIGMDKSSPVRVAFGEDGAGHTVRVKSPISLRMIGTPGALHPSGKEIMRDVPPGPAGRYEWQTHEVCRTESRAFVVPKLSDAPPERLLELAIRLFVMPSLA